MNNLEFDHADIFRDLFDVKRTFTHVRRIVSPLGAIVENGDDENIASLEPTPWVRRLKVGFGGGCDVRISGFVQSGKSSSFRLSGFGVEKSVEWPLAGEFNARNAAMAIVGASLAGGFANPLAVPADCLSNFRGVRRRQEVLLASPQVVAVEDFGHHPTAIALTVGSLRKKYPQFKIWACFEPRSNTAKRNVMQDRFRPRARLGGQGFHRLGRRLESRTRTPRGHFRDGGSRPVENSGVRIKPALLESLESAVRAETAAGGKVLCAFFSNGSFDGIHRRFAEDFKRI